MAMEADLLEQPSIPVWTVYDRMVKAREQAKIKSTERMAELLSAKLGCIVKGSTVGAWERGANQPTRNGIRWQDMLQAWAEVCNVNLTWLAYGEGTRSTWSSPFSLLTDGGDTGATQLELPIRPTLTVVRDL